MATKQVSYYKNIANVDIDNFIRFGYVHITVLLMFSYVDFSKME